MKEIQLTQGKVALVDDEDFERVNEHKWYAQKGKNTWYAYRRSPRMSAKMHRFIMNTPKELLVDHIDSNGLDNRRCNLRECSAQQNCMNTRISKRNTSGFKGVCWHKRDKNWYARIGFNKKKVFLGCYSLAVDAAKAYDAKAAELFGSFAKLNFPER